MNAHSQPLSRPKSPVPASAIQSHTHTSNHSPSHHVHHTLVPSKKKATKRKSKARASRQGRQTLHVAPITPPVYTIETAPLMTDEGQLTHPHLIALEGHPIMVERLPHFLTTVKGLKLNPEVGVVENITHFHSDSDLLVLFPQVLATIKLGVCCRRGIVDLAHFETQDAQGRKSIHLPSFEHDFLFFMMFKFPEKEMLPFEEEKEVEVIALEEDAQDVVMSRTKSEVSSAQEEEEVIIISTATAMRDSGSSLAQQQELRERLERVLNQQHDYLRELQSSKVHFSDLQAFQSEVINELNQITEDEGLDPYFSSTTDPTYTHLSLKCSGCQRSPYVWFSFNTDPEKTTFKNITFFRFTYGHGQHLIIENHLNPGTKKKGKKPVVPPKEGSKVKKSKIKKSKAKK